MTVLANTSDYWSKILKLDQPPDQTIFNEYHQKNILLSKFLYGLFNFTAKNIYRTKVHGLENLPQKGPYIIASNHLSVFDYPFVVYGLNKNTKDNLFAVAKKCLFDRPWLKFFVKMGANAVPVDVDNDFLPALRVAANILRLGKSIYIAPEGTRSFDGRLGAFRVGVGVLAVELNVPIVPVCIEGTYEMMHRQHLLPHLSKVKLMFGKPILMHDFQKKKQEEMAYYVYKEVTDLLRKNILEMQSQLKAL